MNQKKAKEPRLCACGRRIKRKYSHGKCIHCYNAEKKRRKEQRRLSKELRNTLKGVSTDRIIEKLLSK